MHIPHSEAAHGPMVANPQSAIRNPQSVSASIGLVPVSPAVSTLDGVLVQAHGALKHSKDRGKNRVTCSAGGEDPGAGGMKSILHELAEAKAFKLERQRIVSLENEQTVGVEVLGSWESRIIKLPQDFFKLCTDPALLVAADRHCLRGCLEASMSLDPELNCHINIFPVTLCAVPVAELLEEFPAARPRRKYCLEVSEQQIVGDAEALAAPWRALRKGHVRVALDNVGFGRSSLESLVLLEPDVIKLDRGCVAGAGRDRAKRRSMNRLVKVARALGAEVIAEGVGNKEDLEAVRGAGVTLGQGLLWGKPDE